MGGVGQKCWRSCSVRPMIANDELPQPMLEALETAIKAHQSPSSPIIAVNERSLMDRSPRIHCQLPTCKQSLPVHRSKLRGGGVGICVFDAETDVVAGLRQYKPHRTQAFCNGAVRQMRARITIHDTTQRQNARSPSLFPLSFRSVSTLGHRITAAASQSHLWSLGSLCVVALLSL